VAPPKGPPTGSDRYVATARPVGLRGPSRVRPGRRIRGLVLLAALAELVAIVTLVGLSMAPVWALAPAVLAVLWAFGWVRSAVRAEQAMARVRRRRPARMPSSPDAFRADGARSTGDVAGGDPHLEPRRSDAVTALVEATPGEPQTSKRSVSTPSMQPRGTPATFAVDGETQEAGSPARPESVPAAEVMVPIVDEDDIPLTWDPVPVPRPTYTMKARAERPEVAPAAVTADPAPVVPRGADGEGTAYDQRRAAGA
jgi:hypothetical protein